MKNQEKNISDAERIRVKISNILFNWDGGTISASGASGISEYFPSIPKLNDEINRKITNGNYKFIKFSSDHKKIARHLKGENISELSTYYWIELLEIVEEIEKEIGSVRNKKSRSYLEQLKSKKPIVFQYHPYPDTGLPYYLYNLLTYGVNIQPEISKDLSYTRKSLQKNNIGITLNSFSHAVAIDKELPNKEVVFIPLFIFNGYGIILKKSLLSKKFDTVKDLLISDEYEELLKDSNYSLVVEKHTDLEYIMFDYLKEQIEVELDVYKSRIAPIDKNHAKEFAKNGKCVLCCTNWVNYIQFEKSAEDYLVITDADSTNHNNLNGLILTREFFERDEVRIKQLINNWFIGISTLKNDILKVLQNKGEINTPLDLYSNHISQQLKLELSTYDLAFHLDKHNVFFEGNFESLNALDQIEKYGLDNYTDLSQFVYSKLNAKSGSSISESDLKAIIARSKKILNG